MRRLFPNLDHDSSQGVDGLMKNVLCSDRVEQRLLPSPEALTKQTWSKFTTTCKAGAPAAWGCLCHSCQPSAPALPRVSRSLSLAEAMLTPAESRHERTNSDLFTASVTVDRDSSSANFHSPVIFASFCLFTSTAAVNAGFQGRINAAHLCVCVQWL